ncbi:Mu-like prophage major head subunit gpT family protein [Rhizobium sp. SL86]|uniref:Mu-like prophage major head subunit gpT family protein n=1 Tax=Rhizobium sp. SL86 TaxID=2995148 RepID=UPI0022748DB7|nr:Mu-like prophage major head subunit gpT family protein [Rhizobium sp. SL86]MCY1668611.1 Mu-like prophage major head subunit gpT family protein [Rhizobium sp. SL86]
MNINASSLRDLFTGFNVSFNKGLKSATSHWPKIAMKVPSVHAAENYSWLEDTPGIREWLGDRIIHNLSAARYVISNKNFEETISVNRNDIEDDTYGIYAPRLEKMGYDVAQHPDGLVFDLLKKGAALKCFDGQYFFDTDHKGFDEAGEEISVSNFTSGENPAWYLLDCSQPLKPLIYQERRAFQFVSMTDTNDANVFFQNQYVYGVDGRCNVGYGLWQLAYMSKAVLNPANYSTARVAMANLRRASGKPLGVMGTHLIVPPTLEETARTLLQAQLIGNGASNVWASSAELIVTPYVS